MNLLAEKLIKVGEKEVNLKLSNKALYRAQKELNRRGLVEMIAGLDQMDLETIVCLMKHCSQQPLSMDELLEADLQLMDIALWLAEGMAAMFTPNQEKKLEKK